MLIFVIAFSFACSKGNASVETVTEDELMSIDDFSIDYRYGMPIEVTIKDGKIYLKNYLIYENMIDLAHDGFKLVDIMSKKFIFYDNSTDFDDNYKDKMLRKVNNYTKSVFYDVDGTLWESKDEISEEDTTTLNDNDLYIVSAASDIDIKVLDYDNLYKYCKRNFDGTWVNVGGLTYKDKTVITDIYKLILEEEKMPSDDVYKHFVILRNNEINKYANYFGLDDYTIVDDFVVQSEESLDRMNKLIGKDKTDYMRIEKIVFDYNNDNIRYIDGDFPMLAYREGDFLSNGMPAFVERVPNAETTDIYGNHLYAHVSKTFDEFIPYCGGTNMAFLGWDTKTYDDVEEIYNDTILGNEIWNDANYIDREVVYHGLKNDNPRYFDQYLEMKSADIVNLEALENEEIIKEYGKADLILEERYTLDQDRKIKVKEGIDK